MYWSRWSTSTPSNFFCVLPRLSPVGEDVPDDAVVPLADDESDRPRGREALPHPAARDEGAEPQDLFVRQSAMGLPAAGRAHARDERSDRTDVCSSIGINVNVIQKLFELPTDLSRSKKGDRATVQRRARPEQRCNYIND